MSKKNKKEKDQLLQKEDVLQAIILGDSFDEKFTPLTLETPRALLPLVNIPLLEYTIECLASSGVEEVYIFCKSHAKKIQEYVQKGKWGTSTAPTVKTIVSTTAESAGDALREVFNTGVIQSDFVLISGDVVSNMNLDKVIKLHKARREKDKKTLMTLIFKKAGPEHRTRSLEDDIVTAIDKKSGRLLYFDNEPEEKNVSFDLEIFQESSEIQIRYDLIDCRIDICSLEVLSLFVDNFDYSDLRKHFVKGILGNSDILGSKIFTHIITDHYAARVKDLRTYGSVTKDIINRWTYPLVPDTNLFGETSYVLYDHSVYKERSVIISSQSIIESQTAVGGGTVVGPGSRISNSIIGCNCKIGSGVTIVGSYLWDGVIVEDNCVITRSIVGSSAKILSGAKIEKGCIISFNVVVGTGHIVPALTKLTTLDPEPDDEPLTKATQLGPKGLGRLWLKKEDSFNSLVGSAVEPLRNDDSSSDEEEKKKKKKRPDDIPDEEKFLKEVKETVIHAVAENHTLDTIVLEVNGLKFAYDASFVDCASSILHSLLEVSKDKKEDQFLPSIQATLKKWAVLLTKFLVSDEDKDELLFRLQDFSAENGRERYKKVFPMILHTLYNSDIIEEDAIFRWAEEQKKDEDKSFLKLCEKFLEWLKENEEGEEDEDEDEDEDDEDEDEDDEDEM